MARITVAELEQQVAQLRESSRIDRANFEEKIAELELANENRGWLSLSGASEKEFSRSGLRTICKESFLFFLKNPLMRRAVVTQADYVFAQGLTIKADNPIVDSVVQDFLSDPLNEAAFTSLPKMMAAEIDLQITANLFFAFFKNDAGQVRVRLVDFDQWEHVFCNPDDADEPWLYLRRWREEGKRTITERWYPDWRYRPKERYPAHTWNRKTVPIEWDVPVHHVKVNAVRGQMFGTSELYAAQDWARAYNKFLTNWSSLIASYARFAWDIVRKGNAAARQAAKARLDSDISNDNLNAPPAVGSAFIHGEGTSVQPIKTAGATTSMEDGRRLMLMVCAALGWPETFFGDVSVGTLATAKSLDRPTELKCMRRQRMWEIVIEEICAFAIQCVAEAGSVAGLSGEWAPDEWGGEVFEYGPDTETDGAERDAPIDTHVAVDFPELVEEDVAARMDAIVKAYTMMGLPPAGTIDVKYATEQSLIALGETSVEEQMDRLFPEGEEGQRAVAAAIADLQAAVEALAEEHNASKDAVVMVLAEAFTEAMRSWQEVERTANSD